MSLAEAITQSSAHDLADLTAFIVSECEMCTQDADGAMVDINNDDVIAAFKAWADMKRDGQGR
ncbi:hypothetical protein [uncultured Tateyamaria sp.]|uniref:hypothetical protein n=1 Tax=uncultured Tateyamaria sp. TaxID=455651 RepID=UPI002618C792|nr:hypothetical protein [uncultured Tateyamaria sp.]